MRARNYAVVAVGAALLAVGTAFPALSAAPSAPAGEPSAAVLAAMQRDLGMSADAARTRLAAEAAAMALRDDVRAALGGSYAGTWFDARTNRLVAGTTDERAAAGIARMGALPRVMRHATASLEQVASSFDAAAAPDAVTGWFVDPADNTVVLRATERAAAEGYLRRSRVDPAMVRIEVERQRPRPLADLVGGTAIVDENGGATCSIGFSATAGDVEAVITAGHCTDAVSSWTDEDGAEIGDTAVSSFPRDDFGVIEVLNPEAVPTAAIDGTDVVIEGSAEAPVGTSVCRSGVTTGLRCGEVLAEGETVNYGGGDVVRGLTATDACAEPGDSGGPFFAGTQAQGMTSGGSGDCTEGGETFFQPVGEVLEELDLTLVTG